jgi:hypothetical protein
VALARRAHLPAGQAGGDGGADQRGDHLGDDDPGEAGRDDRGDAGRGAAHRRHGQGTAHRAAPQLGEAARRLHLAEHAGGELARGEGGLAGEDAEVGAELGLDHEQHQHLGQGGHPDGAQRGPAGGWGRGPGDRDRLLGGEEAADPQRHRRCGTGRALGQAAGDLVVRQARVA